MVGSASPSTVASARAFRRQDLNRHCLQKRPLNFRTFYVKNTYNNPRKTNIIDEYRRLRELCKCLSAYLANIGRKKVCFLRSRACVPHKGLSSPRRRFLSETSESEYSTRRIQICRVPFCWDHIFTCSKNRDQKIITVNGTRKISMDSPYRELFIIGLVFVVALLVCRQSYFFVCG